MDINFYKDYYSRLTPSGLEVSKHGDRIVIDGFDNEFKKGGNVKTWRNKYNEKYGYSKNASHDLDEISKDTGISIKGLQQIYNKGVGAFKTNPSSVRPNVKSKEQWGMGRVYSAVMGGKASKVDAKELKMETGGLVAPNGKPSNLTPDIRFDKGGNVGESITFYERTYADGTKKRFSVEDYEKNIYPFREKKLKMELGGELKRGIKTEMEHKGTINKFKRKGISNREVATMIAKDHLKENPKYYSRLAQIEKKFAEGGRLTQYEVEAMQEYIKDPNSNPKMVKSFTQVLKKFGADVDTDSKRYDVGKYIDTYNFQGYEYMEEQNQKMGVKFLLTGEYKLVSKAIYERDYSMWLYYNYLGRISISFDDMQNWLNEAIDYFKYTLPIDILLKHTPYAKDGRSYCLVFAGSRSQVLSTIGEEPKYEYEGTYYYTEIGMVGIGDSKNGGWGEFYRERKTGLTIPEYQKTAFHFNTLIHEFAHALDFQKQFLENINKRNERQIKLESGEIDKVELTELEKQIYGDSFKNKKEGLVEFPIVNHFDYFIDSLIEILRASASGKIPLSYVFEKQALQVQTALSGVYGDLLLEQRERKRKEALMVKRDDEMRDNKRFTWQGKVVFDVKEYVLSNAIQDGLKEALKSKTRPFTLTEILEYDNLISNYVEDRYKPLMIESPQRATALLDSLKEIKKETNRIINNHYDNIINKFAYGFRPENDLDKFLLINCKDNLRNYKNWKQCSKEIISSKL